VGRKRLPTWTHPGLYGAARLAATSLNALPLDVAVSAARAMALRLRNERRLARCAEHIAWCFPEWTREQAEACALEAHQHVFALAVEIACSQRFLTADGWPGRVELDGLGGAIDALASRRPAIVITGHVGNWEILGSTLGLLGLHVNALYRPVDIKPLDAWIHRTRARRGVILVDKFGASERLPALLEKGEPVGFIADQNAGRNGLFAPFHGRLASTYKTIGLLALRYEAPIVCGWARRLSPRGEHDARPLRYRIEIVDTIQPEEWAEQPDPLFYTTARYRRAIEEMTRRAPEQCLWMHRFWKSRPRHERMGRPFPDSLREKLRSLPWMTEEELARIEERSARDAAELATA